VSISNYIHIVQCLIGPLRRRQRASPNLRLLFFHLTRRHTPQDVCHQHIAVKTNTASDYTSALVTWQTLCRFIDLILASHVILTPKLDKSRAPTISHIFFIYLGISENFISTAYHRTAHRQHTMNTHVCLAAISSQARACIYGNISTPMP
jgi:hypothetical protein